jgi:hypothetical protein
MRGLRGRELGARALARRQGRCYRVTRTVMGMPAGEGDR